MFKIILIFTLNEFALVSFNAFFAFIKTKLIQNWNYKKNRCFPGLTKSTFLCFLQMFKVTKAYKYFKSTNNSYQL